jgi:hypothetical protein
MLPLHDLLEAYVFAAQRLHGDDTPVPVIAKGKTVTAARGHTLATTGLSVFRHRLPQSSATLGTVRRSIRADTSPASPACSRPMP